MARFGRVRLASLVATWVAALAAVGVASSCREPTSIEIVVRTSLPLASVRGTAFVVGGDPFDVESRAASGYFDAVSKNVDPDGRIGTLVSIPPSGRDEGRVSILVVVGYGRDVSACRAPKYEGCIVARRILAYRPHTRLVLRIGLDPICAEVPCDALSTCANGNCASSSVSCGDDEECAAPSAPPTSDAGAGDTGADGDAGDAGAIDAANDADGATDGSIGASTNLCPIDAGSPTDCTAAFSASTHCCYYSSAFACATACSNVPRFACTGRKYCGAQYCCADYPTMINPTSACNAPGVTCPYMLCSTDGDCLPGKQCTGRYFPNAGSLYLRHCQ